MVDQNSGVPGFDVFSLGGKVLRDVAVEVRQHDRGQGSVAGLAAFHGDVGEATGDPGFGFEASPASSEERP
jgi:hypothetical protein